MKNASILDAILEKRGISDALKSDFLQPQYSAGHDPFLLPDMRAAVDRLVVAHRKQERITIYGDYDIDGLTATTVLMEAFETFGFEHIDAFIPNRFVEGYGLTIDAVEKIAETGAQLIITVDCGSLSEKEIVRANELGVDIIVTDHHNVAPVQPPAIAVINPKRILQEHPDEFKNFILNTNSKFAGNLYPFLDLPGVGVAFKLVQALQTELDGLKLGQEKWLLDLVALGTVCDVVTLRNENRMHVFWGLRVLAKTRRPGLRALMAVAGIDQRQVNARHLGFGLGPRMNASGRLETARYSLDMLRATDGGMALQAAQKLDEMNIQRRAAQDKILKAALVEAEQHKDDAVLVVSGKDWNHGIIGIVAAKLLEKYQKPTYVLEEIGSESKGSARSYGDFSAADAIRASDDLITKGGGHKLAAGVTLPTKNIQAFRERVNLFYQQNNIILSTEQQKLLPIADVALQLKKIDELLINDFAQLEPFGNGNPQPIITTASLTVQHMRRMGTDGQHVKLQLTDGESVMDFLAFSAPDHFFAEPGARVTVWYTPELNEWGGRKSVEGRLLHLEACTD